MQCLLDSIIYLLAIMGIIFTTMTFFEMFIQKKIMSNTYRIFSRDNENNNSNSNKKIEVVVHIENLDEKEEEKLMRKIIEEDEINFKEIATTISIQKDK